MATISTPRNSNEGNASVPEFPGMALVVTPSDTDVFETPVNLYNNSDTAVAVSAVPWNDEGLTAITVNIAPYSYCPFRVRRVLDAGTDNAADLLAVY